MVTIATPSGRLVEAAMTKLDVLDHGFVRLVDSMGSDLSVVRAARVYAQAMKDLVRSVVPECMRAMDQE